MTPSRSVKISVIIAARVGQEQIPALDGLVEWAGEGGLEVLVVRGNQPSRQRNRAADQAQGEILYFLDDDSLAIRANCGRLMDAFKDPDVAVLGGPNLCPADASFLQQVFAALMGNRMVFGPSCARYRPVGQRRSSSEKELILCNMAIRASEFRRVGGFDESLYPNEENALLDELGSRGAKLVYDPELVVRRYPRTSLVGFVQMLYRYGRGRGEQVRLHPSMGSALNFVPAFFVVYVLSLAAVHVFTSNIVPPFLIPLVFYVAVSIAWTLATGFQQGLAVALSSLPLIPVSHIAYGIGLWKGLAIGVPNKPLSSGEGEIVIERPVLS